MRIDAMKKICETYKIQSTAVSKKTNVTVSKDQVTFFFFLKDFARAKKMLSDVPDVRTDKVEDLKACINRGTYNVQAEEVAGKILSQLEKKERV